MPRPDLRPSLLLLVLLALVAAGCGGGSGSEREATPEAGTEAPPGHNEVGCRKVEAPEPKGDQKLAKPTSELDPSKEWVATVASSCGEFQITLDVERAPKTGASFAALARRGFFDGTTFHRVSPGFVIQGGDPLGNGTGGPGYSVREAPPEDLAYTRGVVAMAKTGSEPPGTSGSQFFVVTGEDVGLPPEYALVGRVTQGQEVVDTIGTVPVDGETPVDPVVIEKVTVSSR
ncbi:MAG TPA: peptidylprolyl isomerase [Solirubrobacteraceae bacterium]|nr:peptidylprolyl isomerase [Solirubrobacteraceae bacterium]